MTKRATAASALFFLAFSIAGCSGGGGPSREEPPDHSSEVAVPWIRQVLSLIPATPGFSPPVASRALGYLGVGLYETVLPGMPGHRSQAGLLNSLSPLPAPAEGSDAEHHWPAAANAVLASLCRELFPNAPPAQMAAIDALEAELGALYQAETSAEIYNRSVARGQVIAERIHAWALTDGGAFGYLTNASPGYIPPVGPGLWEPPPPGFAPPLQAAWGANRTFCIPSGEVCHPGTTFPPFSTTVGSEFYNEALSVRDISNSLTASQTEIALFWADGGGTYTPPGHWFSILAQLLEAGNQDLAFAAEACSRLGVAVADAFIACWNAKYSTNLMPPATYIQANIHPGWLPLLPTPPFPEFTSGHSTQSGAAAVVLTRLYGENFAFTDAAPGFTPRSFGSFREAAEEAAISRLYGGIHYPSGVDIGVDQGLQIGHFVNGLRLRVGAPTTSGNAAGADAEFAHAWFDLARELIRTTPGFSPPVASRALGYLGVGLHESVVRGLPGKSTLSGKLNELTPPPSVVPGLSYHWPSSANAALADLCRFLWRNTSATNLALIDALESTHSVQFQSGVPAEVAARSVAFGREVATSIGFWSRSDGAHFGFSNNFPAGYMPPVGPGLWAPTAPGFQSALQPYWGQNRPMALSSGNEVDPGAPAPYSTSPTSAFYAEALTTFNTSMSLTPAQVDIANWWSDGGNTYTPPGHSISLASIALRATNARLGRAAEVYAAVGVGVCDAFISCWESKYRYNLLRPITYIQSNIDPAWMPLLSTPPFPEYTSGHSVQSGASAQILESFFGANFAFIDTTNAAILPTIGSRTFGSFREAANEAAVSRLYGGIHFPAAIETGVQQGIEVGKAVLSKFAGQP